MQKSAQRVSKLWHDRPQSVMDSAIYWTEYVARHGSAPPSLPSKGKTLLEQFQLDVAVTLMAISIIILLLFYFVYKCLRLILKIANYLISIKKIKKE